MPAPAASSPRSQSAWQPLLDNRIPVIGSALRRLALMILAAGASSGNPVSAEALAALLDSHWDGRLIKLAEKQVVQISAPPAWNAIWDYWCRQRGPRLGEVLKIANRPAVKPADTRALSLLFLQNERLLQHAPAALIEPLSTACRDQDPLLAARARYALTQLKDVEAVAELCSLWRKARDPILYNAIAQAGYQPVEPPGTAVYVALKFNRLDRVTAGSPAILPPLLEAAADTDDEISTRARFCLANLQDPATIDDFCCRWAETRQPLLESALRPAGYVASQPALVKHLTALKTGRLDICCRISPEELDALLQAAGDVDEEISARAVDALKNLERQDAREAVCQLAVDSDNPLPRAIAIECAYRPANPEQLALFLFMTDQWEPYEVLDFNQQLLNHVYDGANQELRVRILRKIQQAGRTDYLTIVTGTDYRAKTAAITPIEAQFIIQTLTDKKEWERLWGLALELHFSAAIEIVRILQPTGWLPADAAGQELFRHLAVLCENEITLNRADLEKSLPLAVACESLRISSRVNAVAFSPAQPWIALGASSRRVVLWDYQHARVQTVHRFEQHSIGQVAFTRSGVLVCAERSSNPAACQIYRIEGAQIEPFSAHAGSVTALIPLEGEQVLSTGRDAKAVLWDFSRRARLNEVQLSAWPRSACASPDFKTAVFLDDSLHFAALPELTNTHSVTLQGYPARMSRGMIHSAGYLPEQNIVVGQHNGRVVLYQCPDAKAPQVRLLKPHAGRVEAVHYAASRAQAITAGAEGEIRFYQFPDFKLAGSVHATGGRLTSLHLSDDGAFMATGSNESTLTLWDLRVQDIPALFSTPIVRAVPAQMAALNALLSYQNLPAPVTAALEFMHAVLQYRFRFDIQVEEIRAIQAGKFDVLLD